MYVTLNQVILVRARYQRPSDPVVYERQLRGERILTLDLSPSKYATDARPYGRLYEDGQGNLCIVPDQWSDEDAWLAKNFVGELDAWRTDAN